MKKFVTFHALRRVAAANLNRDDLGNPKTMTIEGHQRTVISPQRLAHDMRKHMFGASDGGVERTRYQYLRHVYEPLIEDGVAEDVARELMYSIEDVVGGRDTVAAFKARDQETKFRNTIKYAESKLPELRAKSASGSSDKEIASSTKETETLEKRLTKAQEGLAKLLKDGNDEMAAKDRRTAEVQVIEIERLNLLRVFAREVAAEFARVGNKAVADKEKPTTADIPVMVAAMYKDGKWAAKADELPPDIGAIFGIKATGDFQPARDGAVYKSFSIALNRQQVDEDYWSATDRYEALYGKKGSAGSAHINTSKYSSDTFYVLVTLCLNDAGKIMRTEVTDSRIVKFIQDGARFLINGSIGAKKTSTNPDSYPADVVIVEFHDDNPCSLLNFQPAPDGEDTIEWGARHFRDKLAKLDKQLDRDVRRGVFSMVDGVFSKTMTKEELCAWAADQMTEAPEVVHTNGTRAHG